MKGTRIAGSILATLAVALALIHRLWNDSFVIRPLSIFAQSYHYCLRQRVSHQATTLHY